MVQARDNHVRYSSGWPGHVNTRGSVRDGHVRYPPGWPGHVKNTWFQLGTTMFDTPLRGLDTLKSFSRSRRPRN
eukprot:779067-Pyramimonas_sp.AAC.1